MKTRTYLILVGVLLVGMFLLANPITWRVIVFLLPLGSGTDDFLEFILLLVIAGISFVKFWTYLGEKFR